MRILAVDIETRPNLAYVWGIWQQNIGLDALVESASMMCWSAKWLGERKIYFRSTFHDGTQAMLDELWDLLDESDAVLHFNGQKFDVPHIRREFLEAGMKPTSPFKQIDLLQTCKRQFRFPSNKLAYVSEQLGLGGKEETGGYKTWIRCMNGDATAWNIMRKYNKMDVVLLEELYEKLQPWIKSHPSHAAFEGEDICPKCGSTDLRPNGSTFLVSGKYPKFRCEDCGAFSRGNKRISTTNIVQVAD